MKYAKWFGIFAAAGLLAGCEQPGEEQTGQAVEEVVEEDVVEQRAAGIDYRVIVEAADRVEADREKDKGRKPATVLGMMGIAPGDTVIDLGSGSGYYAEIFARAVGPEGTVYGINLPMHAERFPQIVENISARAAKPGVSALEPSVMEFSEIPASYSADAAFIGQIYHDLVKEGIDREAVNKAVFNALEPGGLYVIEDHIAPADADPQTAGETWHRVPPAVIRDEVSAAGFELVAENYDLFANPDDPLDISVFDETIRGNTARVLFVFRKPEA